jgi:membrane glycosyltransferase
MDGPIRYSLLMLEREEHLMMMIKSFHDKIKKKNKLRLCYLKRKAMVKLCMYFQAPHDEDVVDSFDKTPHILFSSEIIIMLLILKRDEMGRACGANGGGEGCIQHFGWEA